MNDKITLIATLIYQLFLQLQKQEIRKPHPPTAELPRYLNPSQLADLVGWAKQTVYQNHHNGKIPGARKIQGRLLFESKSITDWIEDNSIKTRAQKIEEIESHQQRYPKKQGGLR